jgi:hypothetical protein
MVTKIKLGLGVFSVALLLGCGGGPAMSDLTADQDVDSAKEDSLRRRAHPELYACQTDADCVAVEKAGCCPNGYRVAVNQAKVQAYYTQFACLAPPAACPMFVVNDTRVAQCNFATHSCVMIAPTDIACGGFIAPELQHSCPEGYVCQRPRIPDAPGSCVAAGTTGTPQPTE